MTATAEVRFSTDGAAKVQSYVRLTASTYIRCCTYEDAPPILTIQDGPADITITNPGSGEVTEDDVQSGRLLAEAVGRYLPNWRSSPARTARRRPTRTLPGRRRDGTHQGGVARAGTSGRPWVLSRVHERGDQVMRKVITGEQVAQLYNRDPFALPVWRAPIYQTPAGFILLVQLARLLGWLARLIARHPLAAATVALLAFMWVNVGWLGLVFLAAWAVVVLAAWRWFWPVSFARWVSSPARGRRRAWFYRRRWAGVMAISGVAPEHQGRVILPVLGTVSATRYTDRVAVRLVSGQSPADVARHADALAHGFGALLCRVRTAKSGRVVLEFVRRDALAVPIPAVPIPANPDLKALPVGRREDGAPWLVRLHGTHVLVAGATGAGKASLLWGLVRAMFPLLQAGLVRVLAADPKLMELAYGRVIFDTYGHYAADPASIAAMLDMAVADMQDRAARFAGRQRDHAPRSRTRSRWCWSMRWRS